MPSEYQQTLNAILQIVQKTYWQQPDFWISLGVGFLGVIIGSFGLWFSYHAFVEAKQAKQAATRAGETVKIQSITIELTDIRPKFEKIQPGIKFSEARDILSEVSWRLRRIASPFQKNDDFAETITQLKKALDAAFEALESVKPADPAKEAEAPDAVYYGTQHNFATIMNIVADLAGLFEKKTINLGDSNAKT